MDLGQILAVVIFVLMLGTIMSGRVPNYVSALIGAALVSIVVFGFVLKRPELTLHVLNLNQLGELRFWIPAGEHIASEGVSWQTIIFIGGMMVLVEALGAVGFFQWLCLHVARIVKFRIGAIFVAFMVLSAVLSMFIGSVTVVLFLASVTIELARMLKFDPVPLIIGEVFAANVGGSATLAGDPPNIIIGTAFGYTFNDFIINTGPIAAAVMLLGIILFYFGFRRTRPPEQSNLEALINNCPCPKDVIRKPNRFKIKAGILLLIVVLLVTHDQTGISVAFIGCVAALLTLLVAGRGAGAIIKRVDWRTLLFLLGLFICVAGLEETGVLQIIADYIGNISDGSLALAMAGILWVSAIVSTVTDNVPLAGIMVSVIAKLSQATGVSLPALAWTLALGTDIGGNATPIGASGNVVGLAVAKKEGYSIGWGRFCKYAVPITVLSIALIQFLLLARYVWAG